MPGTETWWLSPTDTCGRPPHTAPLAQVSISDKAARNLWRMAVQGQAESALGEAAQLGRPARRPKSRATYPRYQRIIRTLPELANSRLSRGCGSRTTANDGGSEIATLISPGGGLA